MTTRILFYAYLIIASTSHIVRNFIVARDEPYQVSNLLYLILGAIILAALMIDDEDREARRQARQDAHCK